MGRRRRRGAGPLASAAVVGLLAAGCGDDDGRESSVVVEQSGGTLPGRALDAVPTDLDLGVVAATDDAGWVTGTRDEGPIGLWRVDDRGATRVAAFPADVVGLDIEGADDRLVGVSTRCHTGEGDCRGWQADVLQFSDRGSVEEETTVLETDRPMEDSDGVLLIGSTTDVTWAETLEGLVGVSGTGEVVERSGPPGGNACALDRGLFRLRYVEEDGETDGDDLVTSSSSDVGDETRTYEVRSFADGEWRTVEDAETFPVEQSLEIGCLDDAIVIESRADGHLVGQWNEEAGWVEDPDTAGTSAEIDAAEERVASRSAGVVHVDDGSVFVRDGRGRMVETGLDLPPRALPEIDEPDRPVDIPPGVEAPAAPVHVATSGDFVIGCVSGGAAGAGNGTICDTTETADR